MGMLLEIVLIWLLLGGLVALLLGSMFRAGSDQ